MKQIGEWENIQFVLINLDLSYQIIKANKIFFNESEVEDIQDGMESLYNKYLSKIHSNTGSTNVWDLPGIGRKLLRIQISAISSIILNATV